MTDPIKMTWPQYERHECTYNGRRVRLTPQLASLLAILLMTRGKPLTVHDLVDALCLTASRDGNDRALHVRVVLCHLRQRLPGLIQTYARRSGFGWLIERPDAEAVPLAA